MVGKKNVVKKKLYVLLSRYVLKIKGQKINLIKKIDTKYRKNVLREKMKFPFLVISLTACSLVVNQMNEQPHHPPIYIGNNRLNG